MIRIILLSALALVSSYQVATYRDQILLGEGVGNTLLEGMELCTELKFKRSDLNPALYVLDERPDVKGSNMINSIEIKDSNVWISDLVTVSKCSNWNQDMILQVMRSGSAVGWLNCGFSKVIKRGIALGLDLSVLGIISLLRRLIGYVFRFRVLDTRPSYPEVRRSVCLSTGLGIKSLKYWAPMTSSVYYDFYIDSRSNVLKIRTKKLSSLSQISMTCGCLDGKMHQVNGSSIELKFLDYHSCLMASVSVGWGHGIIAYRYNFAGTSPSPYRSFQGIEIYNPGTPAMLLGVGRLGDEGLGAIDCLQNQNDRLWPDYT